MGEIGDYWREAKDYRDMRERLGVECPKCREDRPNARASMLMPGRCCKVDGYRDPRSRRGRGKGKRP